MGDGGVGSSVTGLIDEWCGVLVEEAGWGGVTEAAPWLFSERDVRDLIRLKKPLFLDSRFLSAASCTLEDGPLTEESLETIQTKRFHIVRKHLMPSNLQRCLINKGHQRVCR